MQEQHAIPAPKRGFTFSYRTLLLVLGALVIAAAIAVPVWQFGFKGSSSPTNPLAGAPAIHFHYPKAWTLVKPSTVAGVPKGASAVLQRKGNSAVLVVLRNGAVNMSTKAKANAEASKINSQLKAKYSDYQFVRAQEINLPNATKSLLFTYVRTKQGVLHTITIIPAGKISFVVETASPPSAKAIGKQIGLILRSARLTYPKS